MNLGASRCKQTNHYSIKLRGDSRVNNELNYKHKMSNELHLDVGQCNVAKMDVPQDDKRLLGPQFYTKLCGPKSSVNFYKKIWVCMWWQKYNSLEENRRNLWTIWGFLDNEQ